jgi:hypothetical protein
MSSWSKPWLPHLRSHMRARWMSSGWLPLCLGRTLCHDRPPGIYSPENGIYTDFSKFERQGAEIGFRLTYASVLFPVHCASRAHVGGPVGVCSICILATRFYSLSRSGPREWFRWFQSMYNQEYTELY